MTDQEPTILVVDDEPDVGRYIVATLCRRGFKAHLAVGGKAAVAQYRARKSQDRHIDLVLSDIVMDDLAGPDLARALKAYDNDVRILFMSGYRSHHLERFGDELGKCEVLSKPFTPNELVAAVRRAMEVSRTVSKTNATLKATGNG